jgi:hypothetical protein
MNRRDRRKMSKKLGILQYQKNLPRDKKFNLIRENILIGKKREVEMKEEVRRQTNESLDETESKSIITIAQEIVEKEEVPLIDALERARIIYESRPKKQS